MNNLTRVYCDNDKMDVYQSHRNQITEIVISHNEITLPGFLAINKDGELIEVQNLEYKNLGIINPNFIYKKNPIGGLYIYLHNNKTNSISLITIDNINSASTLIGAFCNGKVQSLLELQ